MKLLVYLALWVLAFGYRTHFGPLPQYYEASAAALRGSAAGIAKFYSPGVFAVVARNRHMALRGDVAGYAAVTDCAMIGRVVWASLNGRRWERFEVLDCSQTRDRARHIREGLVIEVDWRSAVRDGFAREGRARAEVWYGR